MEEPIPPFDSKADQLEFLLTRFNLVDETRNLQPFAYEPRSTSSGARVPTLITVNTQQTLAELIKHNLLDHDKALHSIGNYRRSTTDTYDSETFFLNYDVPQFDIEDDDLLEQALNAVADHFRPKQKIRPVHFCDLKEYPWNLSTSAERPYTNNFRLKKHINTLYDYGLLPNAKMSFHNLFNWIFGKERTRMHQIKEGKPPGYDYIVMHQKTALVEKNDPNKVRSVFGVPKLLIFAEAMFFWPLFREYLDEGRSPLLWGYETLNGGWLKLSTEVHSNGLQANTWGSIDWKSFDMRFYFWLRRKMKLKQREYFDFNSGYIPTGDYTAEKMQHEAESLNSNRTTPQSERIQRIWDYTLDAVEDSPCILPSGRVYKRKFAGQPSGIFTTQFDDSFYNAIITLTTLLEMGYSIRDLFYKTLGDDILFLLLCLVPPSEHEAWLTRFSTIAKRRFNAIVSLKKTKVGNGIHRASVLSYINIYGLPYRDDSQLLAQLMYTKGYLDTPSRAMARAIGIAFAAGPFNHNVYRCCKAIYTHYHQLGFTPNSKELLWMEHAHLLGPFQAVTLDAFPTRIEVHRRLTQIPHRSRADAERYWKSFHFQTQY
jgi:hypothetical protein